MAGSIAAQHHGAGNEIVQTLLARRERRHPVADPEDQAVFRKYVEKQFWLADKDKRRLPLKWVGMTADAQSVVVFQEVLQTPASKVEVIHDEVMIDFLPDQLNTVNLTVAGSIRTFGFSSNHPEFSVH